MEIKISKNITIKTIPLNWVVLEKSKDPFYLDNLNQVIHYLRDRISKKKLSLAFSEIMTKFNLSQNESLSAYHLTKIKHHPDFAKKVSHKSLENLKSKPILSIKNETLPKIRARP